MSRTNDPHDNRTGGPAFAESSWSLLIARVVEGGYFLSVDNARTEASRYIEWVMCRVLNAQEQALTLRQPVLDL